MIFQNTVYKVECRFKKGNFECRTRTGYLVPLVKDARGGTHNANPMPKGYVDCKWNANDWGWECYGEAGSYRMVM